MSARPKCPCCGSFNIELPGFVPFKWSRGAWRPQIKHAITAEAEGAPLTCQDCNTKLAFEEGPPFNLQVETPSKDLYR